MGITTIVFDLGGVIIDLDKGRCIESFKRLGYENIEEKLSNFRQTGEFLELEEGRIDVATWRQKVRTELNEGVTDQEIDTAFNDFLVGIPLKKLQMLRSLRKKYRVAMLSNTNALMFETKIPQLFKVEGLEMEEYFDIMFLSYKMNMSKPSSDIYTTMLQELNCNPSEVLFLDDGLANIDAAKALGINTMHIEPYTDFCNLID